MSMVVLHYWRGAQPLVRYADPDKGLHEWAGTIMECGRCDVHRCLWASAELLASAGRGTLGEARGNWRAFTPVQP